MPSSNSMKLIDCWALWKTHALLHSLQQQQSTNFGSTGFFRKFPSLNDTSPFLFGRKPWLCFRLDIGHRPHPTVESEPRQQNGKAPIMELPNKMSTKQVRFEQSDLAAFLLEKLKRGILALQLYVWGKFLLPGKKWWSLKKKRGNKSEDNTFFFLAPGNVLTSMFYQMLIYTVYKTYLRKDFNQRIRPQQWISEKKDLPGAYFLWVSPVSVVVPGASPKWSKMSVHPDILQKVVTLW